MIIDGKKMAEEIKAELKAEVFPPEADQPRAGKFNKKIRLAVIKVGEDKVTEKFLEQKKKFGIAIGVDVRIYEFPENISTNELRKKLAEIVHVKENTGVIIQLPLPKQINTQYILDGIITEKDPDMLSSKSFGLFASGRSKILPPVVAAIDYIFKAYDMQLKAKKIVVLGAGRLVGKPVATWLINQGAAVTVVDENTLSQDTVRYIQYADVIISGVGRANLIKPEMVKEGIMVIDAGASESNGKVVGDVDTEVSKKAALFSPVPGGVGPLNVAMLFKNLVELAKK